MNAAFDYRSRLARLRSALQTAKVDGILIATRANTLYLSGLPSTNSFVLATPDHAYFFTDFRYIETAEKNVHHLEVVRIAQSGLKEICGFLQRHHIHRLGFEESWSFASVQNLRSLAPANCELVEAASLLRELRSVKEPAEIDAISRAQRLNERVLRQALRTLERGVRELDLARAIRIAMLDAGVEEAFETIVAFGPTSSLPHARPGKRRLGGRGVILIDMGVKRHFYHSDMTRTFAWGKLPTKMRDIYRVVLEAQASGLTRIREGATAHEVDSAARSIITAAGYGDFFGHGLGHGVGLEIHEAPTLNPDSNDTLREGMVVTVEPGIYLPNIGGVRIEDLVLVTRDGYRNLTRFPKAYLELE